MKFYGIVGRIFLTSTKEVQDILEKIYDPQFVFTSYHELCYRHQGMDLLISPPLLRTSEQVLYLCVGFDGELDVFEILFSKLLMALEKHGIKYEMDPIEESD